MEKEAERLSGELRDANIQRQVLQSEIAHTRSQGIDPEDIMEKLVKSEHELSRTKVASKEARESLYDAERSRDQFKAQAKEEMERRVQAES